MAAYVFGMLVLLLLWGAGLEQVMAYATRHFKLMVSQALLYWAILLAVGFGAAVLLTELVLPHSKLVSAWTLEQLQAVTQWSHGLNLLLVVGLFVRVYLRLVPRLPKVQHPAAKAATAVKARGRPAQKRQA